MSVKELFVEDFRHSLNNRRLFWNQLGIERVVLKPYVRTSHEPDDHSKEIIKIADFDKAFMHNIQKENVNNIAILGPQGRGKTNIFRKAIKFSRELNVPFSWKSNLYLGEGIMIHRKLLAAKHVRGEQILVDEAEFLNRPNSLQKRDFLWTLSSGRDAGISIWVTFPTKKDFDWSIINSHFDWVFMVSYRDQPERTVKYKIFYRVTFENQFHLPEFVEYPHVGATFIQPFLPLKEYKKYRVFKDKIYDIDIEDNWYASKRDLDRKMMKAQKQKEKEELTLKADEIIKSDLMLDDKISKLLKISYPKGKIARGLNISKEKLNILIDDNLLSDAKLKEKKEKKKRKKR